MKTDRTEGQDDYKETTQRTITERRETRQTIQVDLFEFLSCF